MRRFLGISALLLWLVPAGLAAAQDCTSEAEPNDTPETAGVLTAGCLTGRFDAGDQELLVLEVTEPALWTFGPLPQGAALDLYRLAGEPPAPGARLVRLAGPAPDPVLLVPGKWLLGLSFAGAPGTGWTLAAAPAPLPPATADLSPGTPLAAAQAEPLATVSLTLSAAEARRRWQLLLHGVPGEMVQLTLTGPEGALLLDGARSLSGPLILDGIGLEAGTYQLSLRALTQPALPFLLMLKAQGPRLPLREDEPNDRPESARPLLAGKPVTGRLTEADIDLYRMTVTDTARLLSATLETDSGPLPPNLTLCLRDAAGVDQQCRFGATPALADLALPPGDWLLAVSGTIPGGGDYRLALRPGPPRTARGGHEPNDTAAQAQPLAADQPMTGRFAGQEEDRFALTVDGPPQLWKVAVIGATLLRVDDPGGLPLVTAFGQPPEPIVAEDLYLPPGRYGITVSGTDSDYTLTATATGALAEGAEVEPNDAPETATLLVPGQARRGRLAGPSDVDKLRFTLDRDGPMVLTVTLPEGDAGFVQVEGPGFPPGEMLPPGSATLARDYPAGDYTVTLSSLYAPGPVAWTARLDWADPMGAPGPAAAARWSGALPVAEAAAFWPWAQRIATEVTLTAEAAGTFGLDGVMALPGAVLTPDPAEVTLAAGETATVHLTLDLPADLPALSAVPVVLRARDAAGAEVRLPLTLSLIPGAVAQGSHLALPPPALAGGFNLASPGFGGNFPAEIGQDRTRPLPDNPARLTDGTADPQLYTAAAPHSLRLDFGAQGPVPVAGFTLTPYALMSLPYQARLQGFELALSADGTTFDTVLTGRLGLMPQETLFPLPAPVPAVAAELRFLDGTGAPGEPLALSEWAVLAAPGWPEGTAINLADPDRGGHVARSLPLLAGDEAGQNDVLLPGESAAPLTATGITPELVIGFAGSRRAALTGVDWDDPALPLPEAQLWPSVTVFAGDSPVGPWLPLGQLSTGPQRRLVFDAPVIARYLRLQATEQAETPPLLPAQIRVAEAPVAASALSAAGWWGQYGTVSPLDPAPEPLPPPTDSAETGVLDWGASVGGTVRKDQDSDRWTFTVPEGESRAALRLTGQPTVLARLTLTDAAGAPVPLRRLPAAPGETLYEAAVTPGATYTVTVEEPPRNIMIAVDVSGSLGPFWGALRAGLSAMAEGMMPGRDFARIIPFDGQPLGEWTDDPILLRRTLAGMSMLSTGSGTEQTVLQALVDLKTRDGAKAILLLTDGATSSLPMRPAMWAALETAGVQVFTAHLGGWDNPAAETRLLMDLARVGGGAYAHLQTQAGIDRALARVSAWTRAPARYGLSVAPSTAPPPAPGMLRVTHPAPPAGGLPPDPVLAALSPPPATEGMTQPPPALELILDASGSMLQRLDGARRVDLARAALRRIVTRQLPPGQPVALRVFGDTVADSCETNLRVPLMPLVPDMLVQALDAAEPVNLARTPLAASLAAAAQDLAAAPGRRVIVVLTDGEETCGGDPEAEIAALRATGAEVTVNIVGFAVGDAALEAVFARWAKAGGGQYFPAQDAAELAGALGTAMGRGFVVRASEGGAIVASGLAGGAAVPVPPGIWRVELDGGTIWPAVEIGEGAAVTLDVPPAAPG